jgi:hypothetical protein
MWARTGGKVVQCDRVAANGLVVGFAEGLRMLVC